MNFSKVRSAYWAPETFEDELVHELGSAYIAKHERLVLSSEPARDVVWAHNVWYDPQVLQVESISTGAKQLRTLANDWVLAPVAHHRRAALIQEGAARKRKTSQLEFLQPMPAKPPATWSLIEPNLAIAASTCSALVPNGDCVFIENKTEPPSRAYLKLWEFMTLERQKPQADARCFDIGAAPGGWTWVLSEVGAHVTAIDKAPLAPNVAKRANVESLAKDAFKLEPDEIGDIDWFFSDMICEPPKLLALVKKWLDSGRCSKFVCTIKFKGKTDFETLARFLEIEGSRARHLFHNKHEVTWWLIR